jgi:hypothetical protein
VSKEQPSQTDAEFVAALLSLVDAGTRHRLVIDLAERVARDVLVAAADIGIVPVPIPLDDDGAVDSHGLVESFLEDIRPSHEAHDYLDDYWNFIWEHAWPEGIADAVLGSQEFDSYAAAELMQEIERRAEDIGLTEPPPFNSDDLEDFVKQWRSSFIDELSKARART